jgi:hypothetical protein
MIKTILLLALCLPLVWVSWLEVEKLVEAWRLRVPDLGQEPDPTELAGFKSRAEEVLDSVAPVERAVICLDAPEAGPTSSDLARALADHGNARKAAREKVDAERLKAKDAR